MRKLIVILSVALSLTLVGCDDDFGLSMDGGSLVASIFGDAFTSEKVELVPLEDIDYEEVVPNVIENIEEESEWLLEESLRLDDMLDVLDEFPETMTVEEVKEEINVTIDQMLDESLYLDGVINDLESLAF